MKLVAGAAIEGVGKRGLENNPRYDAPITLAEAGIDKNLANEARKLAAIAVTPCTTIFAGCSGARDALTPDVIAVQCFSRASRTMKASDDGEIRPPERASSLPPFSGAHAPRGGSTCLPANDLP